MTFQSPFDPPPDPAYLRFVEGLKKYVSGADRPNRIRWNGTDWHTYAVDKWILEDVSLAPTPSGVEYEFDFGSGTQMKPKFPLGDFKFPDLFKAVQQITSKNPKAIWNPRSGEWRVPHETSTKPPDKTPGKGTLSQATLDRIAKVDDALQRGILTPDQAAKLKNDIIAEDT